MKMKPFTPMKPTLSKVMEEHDTQASTWRCGACGDEFLMDFAPDYCPCCGEEFDPKVDDQTCAS